jgi:hypothetical protein
MKSPVGDGRIVHTSSEEPVCETEGTDDPICPPQIAAQEPIPVEVGGAGFEGDADVTQPQRAGCAMGPHVQAEQPQVILRSQDPDLGVTEKDQLRSAVKLPEIAIVQQRKRLSPARAGEAAVQVDRAAMLG